MDLIKKRFHINIGRSTVALYLKRWGFTPQKPAKRAAEALTKILINFNILYHAQRNQHGQHGGAAIG